MPRRGAPYSKVLVVDEVVAAFAAERDAANAVLRTLPESAFALVTNCPPWTLAELVIHTAGTVRTADLPDSAAEPCAEAADYYRRPERDTENYRRGNVERAQQHAASVLGHMTAVQYYDAMTQETLATLRASAGDRVVQIPRAGAMRMGDWARTRLIALTVHGIDAAITLDRPPWTTPAALSCITPVLVSLLGQRPPAALNWDDQKFLEFGTGRRSLSESARTVLGPLQDRFPLLS